MKFVSSCLRLDTSFLGGAQDLIWQQSAGLVPVQGTCVDAAAGISSLLLRGCPFKVRGLFLQDFPAWEWLHVVYALIKNTDHRATLSLV